MSDSEYTLRVRMSGEFRERIQAKAEEMGVSMSDVVRIALNKMLEESK